VGAAVVGATDPVVVGEPVAVDPGETDPGDIDGSTVGSSGLGDIPVSAPEPLGVVGLGVPRASPVEGEPAVGVGDAVFAEPLPLMKSPNPPSPQAPSGGTRATAKAIVMRRRVGVMAPPAGMWGHHCAAPDAPRPVVARRMRG